MNIERNIVSRDDAKLMEKKGGDFLGVLLVFVSTVSDQKLNLTALTALMKTSICFCYAPENRTLQQTDGQAQIEVSAIMHIQPVLIPGILILTFRSSLFLSHPYAQWALWHSWSTH